MRCGYCSETVLSAFELTSCRSTTLDSVIDNVGPWGRCETIRASGTPRVSWTRIRSVMFCAKHVWRRSLSTVFPRFRRMALGKTKRSSCINQATISPWSQGVLGDVPWRIAINGMRVNEML
jgi:hypothetical protein